MTKGEGQGRMSDTTTIEWTATHLPDGQVLPGYTFNPWWGCQRVSPACEHCYAETLAKRTGHQVWGPPNSTPRRFFADKYWARPLKWDAEAGGSGVRRKVFCASMSDVFEESPDQRPVDAGPLRSVTMNTERARLWKLIEHTPNLDWLLLTKRPENILGMVPGGWIGKGYSGIPIEYDGQWGWPDNVWVGTTVESQEYAEKRIYELLKVPARVRFLSMEPLLGPVDLSGFLSGWPHGDPGTYQHRIDWVIAGGESGAHARPTHPDWFRSLRDQCQASGVPFHFKQWGEYGIGPSSNHTADDGSRWVWLDDGYSMYRWGKHRAGRILDGRTWDEFPVGAQS